MLAIKRCIHEDLTVGKFISTSSDRDVILLTKSVQLDKLEFDAVKPSDVEQCEYPQVFISDHSPSLMRMDNHGDMFQKATSFFYCGDYTLTDYIVTKDEGRLSRDGIDDNRFIRNFANHSEWFTMKFGKTYQPDNSLESMFFHSQQVYTSWLDNFSAREARFLTCPQLPYYPTQHGNQIHVLYISELWFKSWAFDTIVNDATIKKFAFWHWVETGVTNLMGCAHMGEWWGDGRHHPIHVPASLGSEDGNRPLRTLVVGAGEPVSLKNLRHRVFDFFRDKDYYYFNHSSPDGDNFTDKMIEEFSFRCGEILVHGHSHLPHNYATVDWSTGQNIAAHLNSWPIFKKDRVNPDWVFQRYHHNAYLTLREGVNKFVTTTRNYELWEVNLLITDVINNKTFLKPNKRFYSYNQEHASSYSQLMYGEEGMPGWYRVQVPKGDFNTHNGFWLDFGSDNFWCGIPDVSKIPKGQHVVLDICKTKDNVYFNIIIVSYDEHHIMESFFVVQNAYVMAPKVYNAAMKGVKLNDFIRVFGGNATLGESVKLTNLSNHQVHINFIKNIVRDLDSGIVSYGKTYDTASGHGDINESIVKKVKNQIKNQSKGSDADMKKSKVTTYLKDSVDRSPSAAPIITPGPAPTNTPVNKELNNDNHGTSDALYGVTSIDNKTGSVSPPSGSESSDIDLQSILLDKLRRSKINLSPSRQEQVLATDSQDSNSPVAKKLNSQTMNNDDGAQHITLDSSDTRSVAENRAGSRLTLLAVALATAGLSYTLIEKGGKD